MAIDKLVPQYLNSDTDQKLVKSVEMTDNLNVRVSENDAGTDGVIKNIKGTDVIGYRRASDEFPSGDNRVIGSVANEKNKEILFLVWNENSDHGIYRMDVTTGKYQKLYQDNVLNFQKFSYADCDVVVNEEEETLFYWTDNTNPPMKVNVNRLLTSSYPASFYSGTNEEKLLSLTVAKQPPLFAPSYNIINNANLGYNNISNKIFQFAYQYKYVDGEISALSEYSTAVVSTAQLKDGVVEKDTLDFYNQVNIYVRNSVADVEKIIVYARQNNNGAFYKVEEIDNNNTSNVSTVQFRNDKISSALSLDEVNKSYDNVPQLARTQAFVGGRLMYGNYTEGYENVDIDTTPSVVNRERPNIYRISARIDSTDPLVKYKNSNGPLVFSIDFSSLPTTIPANSKIYIDFTIVSFEFEASSSSTKYTVSSIPYKFNKAGFGETEEVVSSITLSSFDTSSLNFPLEGIYIKKEVSFSSATSRANAIDEISNALQNDSYTSIIKANYDDKSESNLIENNTNVKKARVWWSGFAKFKLVKSGNAVNTLYSMYFSGAEIFPSQLNVWLDASPAPLTGSFEATTEILKSNVTKIGGVSGYDYVGSNLTSTVDYTTVGFSGQSSYLAESTNGYKSFKENATHNFGVVYFDDKGRAGGVNKIDSVYVPQLSERSYKFSSNIDFRIKNNPPSWARKWQMVYGLNSTYDKFIQYSIKEALPSASTTDQNIYLSMDNLEGKPNSYKESTGANIEYKFEEGDKLRVIRYEDNGTYTYPVNHEFNVVGYKYFSEPEEAPFLLQAGYSKTISGWYLVIEDNDIEYFKHTSVLSDTDKWDNNTLVEIYTPKKELEEKVYYGMGKMYDVVNGYHYGDRDVLTQPSALVSFDGSITATSSDRLYVGDSLTVNGVTVVILSVKIDIDGTYTYTYSGSIPATLGTFDINNYTEANITANQGDVYFRLRKIKKPTFFENLELLDDRFKENTYAYDVDFIEDASVSDFFSSKAISIGKPYAHLPEAKTIRRISSITYSDAYVIDSNRLNLSSFNLSLANWTDLNFDFGEIYSMINRGDALTVIQQSKASQLPVSRNLIEYASGEAGITVSKNVLGIPSYYAGDYGTSSPESVVERFGVVYYVDAQAAKVLRLSADGITPISDKGMSSFFDDLFNDLLSNSQNPKIVGGFDPDNDEYIITIEPSFKSSITIGSEVNTVPVDADNNIVFDTVSYSFSTILWNTIAVNIDEFCGDWDDTGNGVVFLDQTFTSQSVIVDAELEGSNATIDVLVTDSSYSFIFIAQLNLGTGLLTIPSVTCGGTVITLGSNTSAASGLTIAYKHGNGVWGSKYSFKPTSYVNLNNELYSFKDTPTGLMWKHNVSETRNNFYGTQYSSMFESVSNYNPSMVKVFEAMGVEGNGTWSGLLTNATQSTTINTTDFDVREGNRYAMIPRDTLVSTGHQIYIGKVESISGDEVTFTTPINTLPFVVGDDLYTASGSTLTDTTMNISGITSRKTIQCSSTVANISVGDNIFVQHNSRVDGDPMRDVFLKLKMTSSDTTPFEVHALSVSYDRSRLHNDRVN